ncbi:MAG: acyltransferase [Pseudonocardiales bacterium]|nr:acyltransferase [Pseudonocardiales bacterium]MBV9030952.1 acyltransferase [Pseudonocardiales bacterium]
MSALPSSAVRLPSLTGYRLILAVAVFSCHALAAARFYHNDFVNGLGLIAPYGIASLSSFFALSGFVLTWVTSAADTAGLFWRRRLVKIFPNHVLTWALTIAVLASVGPMPLLGVPPHPGPALTNLFLVQAWIPNSDYLLSVDGINWSVSCELFFYALLPLLVRPLMRIPADRLWRCFAGTAVVMAVVPAMITYAIDAPPWPLWPPLSFVQTWLVYFFPLVRFPEFLLGVLSARIVQTGRWPRLRARWVALFAVLVWLATLVLPAAYSRSGILAVPICLFIPIIAVRDTEGREGWLSRRGVVLLGNASYAFYLIHWPLLGITRHLVGAHRTFDGVTGTLIIIAVFVVAQLTAVALYRYFERPLMRRFASPPPRDRSVAGGHLP